MFHVSQVSKQHLTPIADRGFSEEMALYIWLGLRHVIGQLKKRDAL